MSEQKQLLTESPLPLEVVEQEKAEENKEPNKLEVPLPSKHKEAVGFGGPKPDLQYR